jgi:hypothetical protein
MRYDGVTSKNYQQKPTKVQAHGLTEMRSNKKARVKKLQHPAGNMLFIHYKFTELGTKKLKVRSDVHGSKKHI